MPAFLLTPAAMTSAPSDPIFDSYKKSCGIDFVRFFSRTAKALPLPASKTKTTPLRAGSSDGMLLTIQEPTVSEIKTVAKELPEAQFDSIEVFYDFTPKGCSSLEQRKAMIENIRQWLISHLYPWQGPGLQVATRVSKGRKHAEPVFTHIVERRANANETLYLGHADPIYADPDLANYAFMRLYAKVIDNKTALLPNKWRCRLELNLTSTGCRFFGLTSPNSLFGFDFRQLGPYFRLARPDIKPCSMPKLRSWNPRMADLLEATRMRLALDTLKNVGSHAASHEPLINVDGHHRHKVGNRMIQIRLDDLTRKFKKSSQSMPYGNTWGSW
ncbi:hypothetical protein [Dechloromonas sp. HYN0024]|uniref:hypothetical protein n=1 Tax=Dechloromonas sp. HYN0024 TaxID=2231055 RepID=UPI000E43EF73|nr:hypothetical protein [Dechloromonas sp. HYN0024]AXS78629.1 hypothetical protein HYN24_00400 [Dechloromonas sp. HYN0024]